MNTKKSNYVIFHHPQRKILCSPVLEINGKHLKRQFSVKYLGILIDSPLNWKSQVTCIVKKKNRGMGIIITKLRYYMNRNILINLYNGLIYPFLIYGIIIWGNTYPTTTHPLFVLQKKATRIMTFSQLDRHSSSLFRDLSILKFPDLVTFHTTIFMHKLYNNMLPSVSQIYLLQ